MSDRNGQPAELPAASRGPWRWRRRPAVPGRILTALTATEPREDPSAISRHGRVYVNRSLDLSRVDWIGFDMDYTLALYNQRRMDELSIRATVSKLLERGYPAAIRGLAYDPALGSRGLVVDRVAGNVFKPDRHGRPCRARHGFRILDAKQCAELYHRRRISLSDVRYGWIDSLFALPEAVIYLDLVEFLDNQEGGRPEYGRLWQDIRECIDLAHRDGSIKTIVSADMRSFIERDPSLAETLDRFRASGKRLFLLTNSGWDYTDAVMRFLLDGQLVSRPSWLDYFEIVVVSALKPRFFTEDQPFARLDDLGRTVPDLPWGGFLAGRVYLGGNVRELERRAGLRGDRVLFVGDHLSADMLSSRQSSSWRTAMILQELEQEIAFRDRDSVCNQPWGPLFREGKRTSKFGEQVEAYACLYTSRVSNFRFYSPNGHFRRPGRPHAP
jgi:5'-nucleotidase